MNRRKSSHKSRVKISRVVLRGDGSDAGSIPVSINLRVMIKDINSGLKSELDLDKKCSSQRAQFTDQFRALLSLKLGPL